MTELPPSESLPVLVSGANGFTGRFVCLELLRRGLPLVALLRPGADPSWLARRGIPVRYADLQHSPSLAEQLKGCRALLNVASIGFGAAPAILQACALAGVQRAVFVSTTAIFTQLNAGSKAVRQAAEAAITASGLDTTILRPTMIYGTPADRNMIRLVRWLDRWPLLPVFGDGRSLQQPVHVRDVAWAVVQVLDVPATVGRAFNLSGAAPLDYNAVVAQTARCLGRRVRCLHLPAAPVIALLNALERCGLRLPLKAEQIQRLNENKAFEHAEAAAAFGYAPISFGEGIAEEVALFRARLDCCNG
jgi:nucleoside-diphosphate-sugar epimerase